MTQATHWVFTCNNPDGQLDVDLQDLFDNGQLRYATWQLECGENGTPHFQGYIELARNQRLAWCCRIIPGAHFEPRRGSRTQARDYARKTDTRMEGPWEVGTFIEDLGPGYRADVHEFRDFILTGADDLSIVVKYPEQYFRYHKAVDRLRLHMVPQRCEQTELHLLFGPPGTGKTTWVKATEPSAYWKEHSKWWEGYRQEDAVVMDEFYGFLPYSFMLRLADSSPLQVECKGSFHQFTSKRVYLISNRYPSEWYPEASKKFDWKAFERRVTTVRNFTSLGEFELYNSWEDFTNAVHVSIRPPIDPSEYDY